VRCETWKCSTQLQNLQHPHMADGSLAPGGYTETKSAAPASGFLS
jgi:hypothetical protein